MRARWLPVWIGAAALAGAAWLLLSTKSAPTVFIHVELAPGVAAAVLEPIGPVRPLFDRPHVALESDRRAAVARTGRAMPDLGRWWRLEVEASHAESIAAALRGSEFVASAFVEPDALPAAFRVRADSSCPIRTPSFQPSQGYLGPAPEGIDVAAAWARPGGRGERIWFADIEGAWNQRHEDLPGNRITHVAGREMADRGWQAHGTAVLGEIAARDNGLGMVGIAPDIDAIFTASIGRLSAASAIDAAQARLRPGDVLLIELHAIGPRGRFLPMEFWDDVFDAVTIATGRGVVVVAAAGNGAENLDHRSYRGKLDREVRDSGAILVGAGAPPVDGFVDRSRLDFSNYGSRVDVQGWGRRVATLDYGDLQSCDGADRHYTELFSGTSSASPVVAGAALLVQSIAKGDLGRPLAPRQLRALLAATGSPQTDGPHGPATQHIGPRPDLRRALQTLGDGDGDGDGDGLLELGRSCKQPAM